MEKVRKTIPSLKIIALKKFSTISEKLELLITLLDNIIIFLNIKNDFYTAK